MPYSLEERRSRIARYAAGPALLRAAWERVPRGGPAVAARPGQVVRARSGLPLRRFRDERLRPHPLPGRGDQNP